MPKARRIQIRNYEPNPFNAFLWKQQLNNSCCRRKVNAHVFVLEIAPITNYSVFYKWILRSFQEIVCIVQILIYCVALPSLHQPCTLESDAPPTFASFAVTSESNLASTAIRSASVLTDGIDITNGGRSSALVNV